MSDTKQKKPRPLAIKFGLVVALIGAVVVLVMNAIDAAAQTGLGPLTASSGLPMP